MAQRSLTSFFESSQHAKKRAGTVALQSTEPPKFVDLFCGAGGASCGAKQVGYNIVLAVDSWDVAIDCHSRNHPDAAHMLMELPPAEPLPLPTAGVWHLHGSPPCTKVSCANQQRNEQEREDATALIRWYIVFAIESSASTWSMEQVSTPIVITTLESLKAPGSPYSPVSEPFHFCSVPQSFRF
jgi:hypothetical protein